MKFDFELDDWQKEILKEEGNIILSCGRQVGKSTIIAIKSAEFTVNNKNKVLMMIAPTERQAYLLYSKTLNYLVVNYPKMIRLGRDKPTKSEIKLINGSRILCLPTGLAGTGIVGYTIDVLVPDECPLIPEDVWASVSPMMVTRKGQQWLLGTPKGRQGYFWKCYNDPNFKKFHVSTLEVAEKRPEPMRTYMLEHIKSEKDRMSKLRFTQEYLGEFMEDLHQFFPDDLIKECMTLKRIESIKPDNEYYLGVDIARLGEDESSFEILWRLDREHFIQVENLITRKTRLTETIDMIINLHSKYNFKKIFIDDGGFGVAVLDALLNNDSTKNKVIAINNASRSLDRKAERKIKLMKDDLYNNFLAMMEKGRIKLLDDAEIFLSLKSVQYEYTDEGQMKIFGNYTHVCEGLIRAAWANTDKTLNIWAA